MNSELPRSKRSNSEKPYPSVEEEIFSHNFQSRRYYIRKLKENNIIRLLLVDPFETCPQYEELVYDFIKIPFSSGISIAGDFHDRRSRLL